MPAPHGQVPEGEQQDGSREYTAKRQRRRPLRRILGALAGGDGNVYRRGADGWSRVDAGNAGQDRAVDADRSRYVPSQDVARGLDAEYAARQRQTIMGQRYAGWGRGGFGNLGTLGGGRYAGVARGGGGRR